jgi:hypothetical protein
MMGRLDLEKHLALPLARHGPRRPSTVDLVLDSTSYSMTGFKSLVLHRIRDHMERRLSYMRRFLVPISFVGADCK